MKQSKKEPKPTSLSYEGFVESVEKEMGRKAVSIARKERCPKGEVWLFQFKDATGLGKLKVFRSDEGWHCPVY